MIADLAPPLRARRPQFGRRLLMLAVLVAIGVAVWGVVGGTETTRPVGAGTAVVRPGQTLWAIAESHFPGDNVDHRIAEIEALNGLGSAVIQPGEILVLPRS